jgi:hypothetical protein
MTHIAEHPDGLGYIVLYGTTDSQHVTFIEAKTMLDRHGLNVDLNQPTKPRAYSRAVAASESRDRIARNVANDGKKRVVRFYHPQQEVGKEDVLWPAEDRVIFDKKTENITIEGSSHKEQIQEDFDHFATHVTGDDIRRMAREVVERLDGISLRGSVDVQDAGGTYFVPIQHRQQLEALGNVLEDLHVGYLRAFGVIHGPAEQFQVAIQAEFTIERQISDIARSLSKLTARVAAAVSYRKQLERLRDQLRDYARLAGRPTSAELQKKVDRALALADAKIAALAPKRKRKKQK